MRKYLLKPTHIILASSSPRRRNLLENLGVKFTVVVANIDESSKVSESPRALVKRLSNDKAMHVAEKHPESFIIAADTVVVVQDVILGKPKDSLENQAFIEKLSGQTHEVYTGYTLIFGKQKVTSSLQSYVTFRNLAKDEIAWYISTGEGLDKAGGYAIQDFGASLVKEIAGCYFNIVGLSLAHVIEEAKKLGVRLV